ncbi:MAG: hypothetical protein JW772_02305 [Candidatus Diapherotrites archaeon]|nr:hypothetical protein [Candidatus Diapherotrites archaeon]
MVWNVRFFLGKSLGFLVSVFVFSFVFLNIIFTPGFWHKNLVLLAELLALALILNLVLPRILKTLGEKRFSEGIHAGGMLFAKKLNSIILTIGLFLTYSLAVGFVFAISKIFGKKFLQLKKASNTSFWLAKKSSEDPEYFKNQF